MSASSPNETIYCAACAAAGRHTRPLTDPLSRVLRMGPTCARRAAAGGNPDAVAGFQLAFDLDVPDPAPRRHRRELAGVA